MKIKLSGTDVLFHERIKISFSSQRQRYCKFLFKKQLYYNIFFPNWDVVQKSVFQGRTWAAPSFIISYRQRFRVINKSSPSIKTRISLASFDRKSCSFIQFLSRSLLVACWFGARLYVTRSTGDGWWASDSTYSATLRHLLSFSLFYFLFPICFPVCFPVFFLV